MDLDAQYAAKVRPWLELAEDLRTLSLDSTLQVPQICVMGDQSSGKSSVLEALSGIPFPRGSGLVTKCPVRLVMRRAEAGTKWKAAASAAGSPRETTADSPTELTGVLGRLMEVSTRTQAFSTDPIIVRLTSEDAPDLTVVDLPGIVRTSTAGQSQAVIAEVNALIDDYLAQERTIILAVIPANQDIATVDILERAQRVDPRGERTLGVLTKPDLVGDGNEDEVMAVVKNQRKPLKLGYVIVKNRSQAQIKQGTSSAAAREDEARFFAAHPVFRKLEKKKCVGIKTLTDALTKLLVHRLQHQLAPMKRQVEALYGKVRTELRSVQTQGIPTTTGERQKLLVTLTQDFVRQLHDCVRGEYRDRLIVTSPTLRLYTRAIVIFQELQTKVLKSAPRFQDRNFVDDLARRMEGLRGRELPGFMSSQSFYMFIQDFIDAWAIPSRAAAQQTRALAAEVVTELLQHIAPAYPALRDAFDGAANAILEATEDEAYVLIETLLVREKDPFTINEFLQAHINKLRYDKFDTAVDAAFAATSSSSGSSSQSSSSSQSGSSANQSWDASKQQIMANLRTWYQNSHSVSSFANAEDLSAILQAYWTLASKRFVDNACMSLDDRILGTLCPRLQESLFQTTHDDEKLEAFFTPDPAIVAKRQQLEALKDRLARATAAMASIQPPPRAAPPPNTKQDQPAPPPQQQPQQQQAPPPPQQQQPSPFVLLQIPVGPQGLGLQLADEQGDVVTRGFRNGSLAQQHGAQLGDVLVEINGRKVTSFDAAIAELKSNKNPNVALTVRRGR